MIYFFISERYNTERSYEVRRVSRFFTSLDAAYDAYTERVVTAKGEGGFDAIQILSTKEPGNFPYIERVPASSGQVLVDETFDPGLSMFV